MVICVCKLVSVSAKLPFIVVWVLTNELKLEVRLFNPLVKVPIEAVFAAQHADADEAFPSSMLIAALLALQQLVAEVALVCKIEMLLF